MQLKEVVECKNMYDLKRRMKFKIDNGYKLAGRIIESRDGRYSCLMVKEIKGKK